MGERDGGQPDEAVSVEPVELDGATGVPTGDPNGPGVGTAPASEPTPAAASDPARRGPGRPRKPDTRTRTRTRTKAKGAGDGPIQLRVDQAGRAPGRQSAPPKPKAAAAGENGDARQTTTALLQFAQLGAVATLGPVAAFTPLEIGLIEPAAVRILSRMDASAVARYGALADPLVLAVGLGMWGLRVWTAHSAATRAASANPESGQRPTGSASGPPGQTQNEAPGQTESLAPETGLNGHQPTSTYTPVPPVVVAAISEV